LCVCLSALLFTAVDTDSEEDSNKEDEEAEGSEGYSPPPDLKCIRLSLPPPPPATAATAGQLAAAAQKGLRKLLQLCGVQGVPGEGLGFEEEDEGVGAKRLSRFLPAAAEVSLRVRCRV
jgi:hypothetical protein